MFLRVENSADGIGSPKMVFRFLSNNPFKVSESFISVKKLDNSFQVSIEVEEESRLLRKE